MNKQLKRVLYEPELELKSKPMLSEVKKKMISFAGADMTLLKAGNFLRDARRKNVVIEATSIHEIDKLIEDKQVDVDMLLNDDVTLKALIRERLSRIYSDYEDVFSKADSDILPPHRPGADHKIVLEKDNNLSPSPLYSMSLKQLEMIKVYLEEHLQKGFIVFSDASFASPILFAKKSEGE